MASFIRSGTKIGRLFVFADRIQETGEELNTTFHLWAQTGNKPVGGLGLFGLALHREEIGEEEMRPVVRRVRFQTAAKVIFGTYQIAPMLIELSDVPVGRRVLRVNFNRFLEALDSVRRIDFLIEFRDVVIGFFAIRIDSQSLLIGYPCRPILTETRIGGTKKSGAMGSASRFKGLSKAIPCKFSVTVLMTAIQVDTT